MILNPVSDKSFTIVTRTVIWQISSVLNLVETYTNDKYSGASSEYNGTGDSFWKFDYISFELMKKEFLEFIKTKNPFQEDCSHLSIPVTKQAIESGEGIIFAFYTSGHLLFDENLVPVPTAIAEVTI